MLDMLTLADSGRDREEAVMSEGQTTPRHLARHVKTIKREQILAFLRCKIEHAEQLQRDLVYRIERMETGTTSLLSPSLPDLLTWAANDTENFVRNVNLAEAITLAAEYAQADAFASLQVVRPTEWGLS